MKRLLMAVLVVLLSSAVACASGFSVSGGAIFDKYKSGTDATYGTSEDTGYYISGSGSLPDFPISFTGSYSSFSSDKITLYVDSSKLGETDWKNTNSLLKLMAGYKLPVFPVAFGAGYVSQSVTAESGNEKDKATVSGLAVGAFGTFAVSEQADIAAEFYYVPNANWKGEDQEEVAGEIVTEKIDYEGSGWVFEVKGSYLITSQVGIEAGYRATCFEIDDVEGADRLGGFFLGAKYSF